MWTKLSADKKSELMKAYKKGGFSYRDMIDDYNTSYEKFEVGGETFLPNTGNLIVPKPTAADSAGLLNNTIQLNNFYTKSRGFDVMGSSPNVSYGFYNEEEDPRLNEFSFSDYNKTKKRAFEDIKELAKKDFEKANSYVKAYPETYPNLPSFYNSLISGVKNTRNINPYSYQVQDNIAGAVNWTAPPNRIDWRIKPSSITSYISNDPGALTDIYNYDPQEIKPWFMRTPAEKVAFAKRHPNQNKDAAKPVVNNQANTAKPAAKPAVAAKAPTVPVTPAITVTTPVTKAVEKQVKTAPVETAKVSMPTGPTKYQTVSKTGQKYYFVNNQPVDSIDKYNAAKAVEIDRKTGLPINMYGGMQSFGPGGRTSKVEKPSPFASLNVKNTYQSKDFEYDTTQNGYSNTFDITGKIAPIRQFKPLEFTGRLENNSGYQQEGMSGLNGQLGVGIGSDFLNKKVAKVGPNFRGSNIGGGVEFNQNNFSPYIEGKTAYNGTLFKNKNSQVDINVNPLEFHINNKNAKIKYGEIGLTSENKKRGLKFNVMGGLGQSFAVSNKIERNSGYEGKIAPEISFGLTKTFNQNSKNKSNSAGNQNARFLEMGGIQRFDEGGVKKYNSQKEYESHLLDKWSPEKDAARKEWTKSDKYVPINKNSYSWNPSKTEPDKNINTTDINYTRSLDSNDFQTYNDNTNTAVDFFNKWHESPRYKEMINESTKFYLEKQNAEDYTGRRKNNVNNFEVTYSKPLNAYNSRDEYEKHLLDPWSKDKQEKTINYLNDDSGAAYASFDAGSGITNKGILNYNINANASKDISTSVHELSHISDNPYYQNNRWNSIVMGRNVNQEERDIPVSDKMDMFMFKRKPEDSNYEEDFFNYVGKDTETRARLNTIRYSAKNQKIYDPFTQKVTKEIFDKLLKTKLSEDKGYDPLRQLREVYPDDAIIEMLNTISQNTQKKSKYPTMKMYDKEKTDYEKTA